jgi:hypothetical protein
VVQRTRHSFCTCARAQVNIYVFYGCQPLSENGVVSCGLNAVVATPGIDVTDTAGANIIPPCSCSGLNPCERMKSVMKAAIGSVMKQHARTHLQISLPRGVLFFDHLPLPSSRSRSHECTCCYLHWRKGKQATWQEEVKRKYTLAAFKFSDK